MVRRAMAASVAVPPCVGVDLSRSPLRLLQIAHTAGYGGLERQVLSLSLGLRDAGHTVVMALQPDGWLAEQAQREAIAWEPVRFRGLFDPFSHVDLVRAIRRWDINVVHGHSRRSAFYSAISARVGRCASVATVHSLQTWKGFARNDRVIAVSDAVRDFLIEKGLPPQQVERIYNGVASVQSTDAAQRDAARRELGLGPDCIAVAMVGRMVAHKGHDLLIEALSMLPCARGRVQAFLVGDRVGAWPAALEEFAASQGVGEHVHQMGYRDDVVPLLRAMDIFVQPSRSEALSLSMLEAMAVGVPVIAARTGGIPEVIEHGRTGLLFPPDDVEALAAHLQALLDPEARDLLAQRARACQSQRFAASQMISATASLYSRLVGDA